MRLQARIRQLERDVHWLKFEGWYRSLEMRLELAEKMQAIAEHKAALREDEARRSRAPRPPPPLPQSPPVEPLSAEAPLSASVAPAGEPLLAPFVHDPPEHMQIRPVTWRIRGPDFDDCDDAPVDDDYLFQDDGFDPFANS